MNTLSLRAPDDFHVHFRQGRLLGDVVPHSTAWCRRALVMPNILPPVVTAYDVAAYRQELVAVGGPGFTPLMTIKLLDHTTPEMIWEARAEGVVAAKLYPRGVTTNAEDGVTLDDFPRNLADTLGAMEEAGMVLSVHGETPGVFCLHRERAFLETLDTIVNMFPALRIVLEHITTREAVQSVERAPGTVAATITVHHLFLTLDDVVGDAIRPHHFCKPVAKSPADREALREAVFSSNPKFFLGTDSAPHPVSAKECAAGCAGVFTAPVALPLLAELFHERGHLDHLEPFVSTFGAAFYRLPRNDDQLQLVQNSWVVPERIAGVVPFQAGTRLAWECRRA